ncbi:hypothetical protein [Lacipirellula parvula]|uniref:Uncharacterized protein n=1 Tax=Lacipirellula parvula TaxID=2650471 RepID=A0A5K7XI86_9BACT|nr:hypothetical protein [Lacipirellula parvula]BBO35697.1 hypothetical protein PLANPX_5309 [Lacipirellula parvula]
MTRLPNAFAWQIGEAWIYTDTRESAAPIAVEVERYESGGRIVLYWPVKDTATLVWNAEKVD